MSLPFIAACFVLLFYASFRLYGRHLRNKFKLSDERITPAHQYSDGHDFIPTKRFYLFAQHFSAIAAAGPIAGPIMASMTWGYLPCLLWIALGVVLIGGVHDFLSLLSSVRHRGESIAHIAKDHLGKGPGLAMMVFIWIALIYVIVAFTDITAASFTGITEELLASPAKSFNPGGAVACAAIIYLVLSMIMGLSQRFLKTGLLVNTIIFVPLSFLSVWLGTKFSTLFIFDAKTWCFLILGYCFISSLFPVWLLLQPRGYLGGFILYAALFIGAYGMFFGNYEIKQPAFISFDASGITGNLFPFLFVTIACGACSGFHGLVCSGTTAKQIDRESDVQLIGYGAMLCEAMVALIALACVMIWSPAEIVGLKPGTIYGKGIGEFLSLVVGKEHLHLAITFGAMAFSTFVFDTLDVSTRLSRYLLQELFRKNHWRSAIFANFMTVAIPMVFIYLAHAGSYLQFWSLFGASNQLLAALSLLTITMWLYRARMRISYTLLPMLFVLTVTCWALLELAYKNLSAGGTLIETINGLVSITLLSLAIYLVLSAVKKLREPSPKNVFVANPLDTDVI